ncbi:hypothetical protein PAXINDRAFT_15704 [Paxillus involutus ATCC 200175]|uniref:Uncharacterized protein n=1 Tax=Paxillus involutus ATCC 200175 TaxID=664439 RepID=A0A0C9T6P7_PAXIN|nr:hypothetical protein PAXINDRAFT_15704 [Paxillus involutus ATCC 200175]
MSRWNQEKLQASNGQIQQDCCSQIYNNHVSLTTSGAVPSPPDFFEHLRETGEIPVVDDVVMDWDFLGAVLDGDIKPDDIVVMVSLDGAQLYQSKESDCWIYVWVLLNMSPDKHYKKINVIPGGFIPGPNKPKNVDSFLFPGLHHVAALQKEGLTIWDASCNLSLQLDIYVLFETADSPGLVYWDGMVEHCTSMLELAGPPKLPSESALAEDLGKGYALLCKHQKRPSNPIGSEAAAIHIFLGPVQGLAHHIQKWAQVQLSNGQIAQCTWREMMIPLEKLQVSHNVKFLLDGSITFGEVQYFTRLSVPAPQLGQNCCEWIGITIIQPYSKPDYDLLALSSQVVALCKRLEELVGVSIEDICSVVGMVPHTPTLTSRLSEDLFFMIEKPGLDVLDLGVPYPGYDDYDVDGGDDDLE